MPNISITVWKHWNILNISKTFQGLLQEEPITAFKRNRNLKEIIESNCIENGKVIRAKNTFTVGKCSSCLSKTGNLCCSQLTSTTTFISQQTKRKFKIYLKVHTTQFLPYENHCECYKKLPSKLWPCYLHWPVLFLNMHSPVLLENKKLPWSLFSSAN